MLSRVERRMFEYYGADKWSVVDCLWLMRWNNSEMKRRVAIRREFRWRGIEFNPDTLTPILAKGFEATNEINEAMKQVAARMRL